MIKNFEDRVVLTFGKGDIGMNPGVIIENDEPVGIMIMYNQTERPIGSEADIKAGTTVYPDEFPMVLKFNKLESVDVLIEALKEVKTSMIIEEAGM